MRVNGGEMRGKLAQHAYRGWLIIDEDAALASYCDLAAQNDGFIFVVWVNAVALQNFGYDLFCTLVDFKDGA